MIKAGAGKLVDASNLNLPDLPSRTAIRPSLRWIVRLAHEILCQRQSPSIWPPTSLTVYTGCRMRQSPGSNGRKLGWGVDMRNMRTLLVAGLVGFFLSTTLGGLLEGAYAQSPKAKSAPQATGQMFCNSAGCRPVKPGCRLEMHRNVGQIEVCGGNRNLLTPTH